jgi:hypothetical protein
MSARKPGKKPQSASAATLLALYERRHLDRLWRKAPFVLRITEWKNYPAPVIVVSERGWEEDRTHPFAWNGANHAPTEPVFASKGILQERGHLAGDALVRCFPAIKTMLREITDDSGVPLELDQFFPKLATPFRGNLPLDGEAGAKLALMLRLSERVKDLNRVELIAKRIERFSREEAAYWLSRLIHFGPVGNKWAVAGLRIVLAGEGTCPEVEEELSELKR